jgi:hypothetical protein
MGGTRSTDNTNNTSNDSEQVADDTSPAFIDNVVGFVSVQAQERIDLPAAPTHLFDWDILHWTENGRSGPASAGFQHLEEVEADAAGVRGRRRQVLVQRFCSQFRTIVARSGSSGLKRLKDELLERLNEEGDHHERLADLIRQRDRLMRLCTSMAASKGDDALVEEVVDRPGLLPEGTQIKRGVTSSEGDTYLWMFTPSANVRSIKVLGPGDLTWGELPSYVQRATDSLNRQSQASVEVQNLIGFRLELLRQFLWAYQVLGEAPVLLDRVVVPERVQSRPIAIRHAVTAAQILADYVKRENGFPETQADFRAIVDEAVDASDKEEGPQSSGALLKGVKDILGLVAESSPIEGADLFSTLYEGRRKLEEYAAEMGVSPWI